MDLVCWAGASVMDCVSSAFCCLSAPATVAVMDCLSSAFCCASAPATATAMVLASAASLDSWSQSLALVEVVAFLSQVLSLFPITFLKGVSKMRTYVLILTVF